MSLYRDELVSLRKELFENVVQMRALGDYSAGANFARATAESLLKLVDLMLERAR